MEPKADTLPMMKMLGVFIVTLVGANLAILILSYVAPSLPIPESMGILFVMVAAMSGGGIGAKATGRRMTTREKASFAVSATLLSILTSVALIWGILVYFGVPFTVQNVVAGMTGDMVPNSEIMSILPWVGLFVVVVSLLVAFFAVGFGANNQLKQAAKQAAKNN